MMIGAITGDVIGSVYEWNNIKTKDLELFKQDCFFTDDTVMTVAVAKALLAVKDFGGNIDLLKEEFVKQMRDFGRRYPNRGYGGMFSWWLSLESPMPYNSFGNGSAMRVSPCGLIASTLHEALALARASAEVTHNHPEGIKGAQATAAAVFLAKQGNSKEAIKCYLQENFYPLDFTLDEIRSDYTFDVTCQGSVPQAIEAFLESTDFEDAIRNAISIGGDSDTIGCITGGMAWAYYMYAKRMTDKDAEAIKNTVCAYLPQEFIDIVQAFEAACQ